MSTHLVRNIFDQYGQPENRVTHALAHVLIRNPRLARDFVRFAVGADPPEPSLSLSCQVFPEEQQESISEDEAERRGIPDLWIYSRSDGWAVVCECKVIAAPSIEQLQRHAKTARRLSFKQARLLVITADGSRPAAVPNRLNGVPVAWTTWPRVFDFLSRRYQYDHLVAEFLAYLRIVEGQAMDQGH